MIFSMSFYVVHSLKEIFFIFFAFSYPFDRDWTERGRRSYGSRQGPFTGKERAKKLEIGNYYLSS